MNNKIFNDGKMLDGIFTMQEALMVEYNKMGMIPIWGPDYIDRPEYQTYLNKLRSWVTDELTESSAENQEAFNQTLLHDGKPQVYVNKYIEELMDVFSFIIELMIYSDITSEDINAYYEQLVKERNLDLIWATDGLTSSMNYARHTNIYDDPARVINKMTLRLDMVFTDEVRIPVGEEIDMLKELCMWDVVKAFSKAGAYLRNKEWKVKQTETNITEYKRQLMIGWLYFMKLMDLSGLEARSIYHFYEGINQKNFTRLANGY